MNLGATLVQRPRAFLLTFFARTNNFLKIGKGCRFRSASDSVSNIYHNIKHSDEY